MSFLLYTVYGFYQLNIKGQGTRDSTIQNENHVCKKEDRRIVSTVHDLYQHNRHAVDVPGIVPGVTGLRILSQWVSIYLSMSRHGSR